MNWQFWKIKQSTNSVTNEVKDEIKRSTILEIPADKVKEIRRLYDAYRSAPENANREAQYIYVKALIDIFPEMGAYEWEIRFPTALRVVLVRI